MAKLMGYRIPIHTGEGGEHHDLEIRFYDSKGHVAEINLEIFQRLVRNMQHGIHCKDCSQCAGRFLDGIEKVMGL